MRLRRPSPSVVISVALHAVLGAGLLRVLLVPMPLRWFEGAEPPRGERVEYVALPEAGPRTAGRDGGDGRPITDRPAAPPPPLVAPVATPTGVPAGPSAPAAPAGGGSGERIGRGGATAGVRPRYGDPRVWAPPSTRAAAIDGAPIGTPERLDQDLKATIQRHNDSLALATHVPGKIERGDWTFGGPGGKWGVEPGKIRLGKFSLPSAVLALLPLNMQGGANASAGQDPVGRRAMEAVRADILYQSQRMLNEDELRDAAKRIRERVDRERREKERREQRERETAPVVVP